MEDLRSRVAPFDGVPPLGLARLVELGQIRRFAFGKHLTVQGETADMTYVIAKGRVSVERSHPEFTAPVLLGELGPGAIVGPEGLLDGESHSATVTALEDTDAIEFTGLVLSVTILKFPKVATSLLRTLSRRLRTTDALAEAVLLRHARPKSPNNEQVARP